MSSIQAGDVVVCVDDSPCYVFPYPGAPFSLRRRDTFRVVEVEWSDFNGVAFLRFVGRPGSYGSPRFRKIEKANKDFIAQIKACRPKRDRVWS